LKDYILTLVEKYDDLDESILAISQCIINLKNEDKIYLNKLQEELEKILDKLSLEYKTTYGEKVYTLSSLLSNASRHYIEVEKDS
jgi:hypothetical protein